MQATRSLDELVYLSLPTGVKTACRFATTDKARCRNWAHPGRIYCSQMHMVSASVPVENVERNLAPFPNVVLLKGAINEGWLQRFTAAGVPWMDRNDAALAAGHEAQANDLGRRFTAYRPAGDSGVPVFTDGHRNPALQAGQKSHGVQFVTLNGLINELEDEGFRIADMETFRTKKQHDDWERKRTASRLDGPMSTLKVGFHFLGDEHPESEGRFRDVLTSFMEEAGRWAYCHVWVNPPSDNTVLHTINVTHREPTAMPKLRLRFDHGFWLVTAAG